MRNNDKNLNAGFLGGLIIILLGMPYTLLMRQSFSLDCRESLGSLLAQKMHQRLPIPHILQQTYNL